MTDQSKKVPIRIPITFTDADSVDKESPDYDDDAIEIDGDALDEDEPDEVYAPTGAGGNEPAATKAEGGDAEAAETANEPVTAGEAATPSPQAAAGAALEVEEAEAPAEDEDEDEEVAPEEMYRTGGGAQAAPRPQPAAEAIPPEFSRDAIFEMMNDLRQKTAANERLLTEKNELYDRLLRRQAEFENFRKRSEREMQEAYVRARADILTDLLPALDNFELAVQHADTTDAGAIREGVSLIYRQMSDILARFGLEPIDANGKPFDPELHEAVATETSEETPDHTVIAQLQRGYKIGDRLLRPARVKVSVQP